VFDLVDEVGAAAPLVAAGVKAKLDQPCFVTAGRLLQFSSSFAIAND
jgi:hypothetical protein